MFLCIITLLLKCHSFYFIGLKCSWHIAGLVLFSVCVFLCVYMGLCLYSIHVSAEVCMETTSHCCVSIYWASSSDALNFIFWDRISQKLGTQSFCWIIWPTILELSLFLIHQMWGYRHATVPNLSCGYCYLNSDPRACIATIQQLSHLPRPSQLIFFFKISVLVFSAISNLSFQRL